MPFYINTHIRSISYVELLNMLFCWQLRTFIAMVSWKIPSASTRCSCRTCISLSTSSRDLMITIVAPSIDDRSMQFLQARSIDPLQIHGYQEKLPMADLNLQRHPCILIGHILSTFVINHTYGDEMDVWFAFQVQKNDMMLGVDRFHCKKKKSHLNVSSWYVANDAHKLKSRISVAYPCVVT